MQKFSRRNKVGFVAATAVAAVLVIAAVISSWQAIRAMRAERHAQGEAKRASLAATRAQEAEKVSIEKATVAENERRRADESSEELRRNLYAADMNAVSEAWEKGDIGLMRKLLENHRPKPGQPDLRGFEWFYFWKLSESEQKELFSFDTSQTAVIRPEDISRDGSLLVIARTNELEVFNWMTRKTVAQWSLPAQDPNLQRDASLTADNKFVAMTDSDGLHLFEIGTLRERILPTGDCEGVRLSPVGHLAAISLRWRDRSRPLLVRIWDYQTGNEVRSISFTNGYEFLAWSSDGKKLYAQTGFLVGLIVWDIDSGTSKPLNLPPFAGQVLDVSPDGRNLVRTDLRGELSVVGVESRRVLASSGFPPGQTRAAFSADGRWFATSGPDGQIVVWESASWKKVGTLRGHSDFVWGIYFLPHENRLVSLGNDRTVRLWEFGQTSNTLALTNNLGALANEVRASCAMQWKANT
jgi:WD40 repeat protein